MKNFFIRSGHLKFLFSQRMEVTKVHRVVSFKHKAWRNPFISKNPRKYKQQKTNFQKNFINL